jgi:hypothetical protein
MAALLLPVTAVSEAAEGQTGGFDGYVAASFGTGNTSSGSYKESGAVSDVQVTLGYTDKSRFGGQLDVGQFKQNSSDVANRDLTVHVYYRSQDWLLGAFMQQRNFYLNGTKSSLEEEFQGLEGQYYLNEMSLYVQLGQSKYSYTSDSENLVALELRYFLNDNLKITGSVDFLKESVVYDTWAQTTIGVGVEYRLQNNPWIIMARLEHAGEKINTGAYSADHNRLMFGVGYAFGKESLRSRDRDGASLRPVAKNLYIPP